MSVVRASAVVGFVAAVGAAAACASLYGIEETTVVDAGGSDAPTSDAADDVATSPEAGSEADAGAQLLAWWSFEEEGGTEVRDRSDAGRHAKTVGVVTRALGKFGRGLVFARDGGDGLGELDCQDLSPALFGDSGTLIFWWRDDDDAPAPLARSAGVFENQTSGREHFFLARSKDGAPQTFALAFQFVSADAGTDDFANGAGGTVFTLKKAEWTKLAVTWTPDGGTLHVGGDASAVSFYRRWEPKTQGCFFGRHAVGAIDEVRIYDRPLRAEEIASFP